MFAKTIVTSDAFLDMPITARCLYFTFGMFADDDGFVNNPKSIMRQIGASADDIKVLCAKKFIIPFESGVIVIKHWRINNYLRNDRYTETKYTAEKALLCIEENGGYTTGIPSIGKVRVDKTSTDIPPIVPQGDDRFEEFWKSYPRKIGKDAARKAFGKRATTRELLAEMLSAIEAQKKSEQWKRDGGQYIPHPATWLNQGRWMDELPSVKDADKPGKRFAERTPTEAPRREIIQAPTRAQEGREP